MKRILLYLFAALVLLGAAGTGYLYLSSRQAKAEDGDAPQRPARTHAYDPGGVFITNLQDSRRFFKVSLVLEMETQKHTRELEQARHRVRDGILEVLSGYTEEEIRREDSRSRVRDDLREVLSDTLGFEGLLDIYFHEFVIQ